MRWLLRIIPVLAAIQAFTALSAFGFHLDPLPNPEPLFVICENQQYALCAEASCFVYNGVAYCKCDILKGDSISLQLSFSSPIGERNVCDVNRQGRVNGYVVSTFSLPENAKKGGSGAVYTCPGSANAGSGVSAPVAYVMVASASRARGARGSQVSQAGSGKMKSFAPARSQLLRRQTARIVSDIRYLGRTIRRHP
jgi:hypothetical protein